MADSYHRNGNKLIVCHRSKHAYGVPMWTCSTVFHVKESYSTVVSMLPRVSHDLSPSKKYLLPLFVVSEKETPPSEQFRSCSPIQRVRETILSAQETCHLLLQLPMIKSSRDFVILSLDGSRVVEDRLGKGQRASIVNHYT